MSELSSFIRHFRYRNYSTFGTNKETGEAIACPWYKGNDQCQMPDQCRCRKVADARGHIEYVIPPEYREKTINHVRGLVKTKQGEDLRVWSDKTVESIKSSLKSYLFGDSDSSNATSREDYNKISKMDLRFYEGTNLIIHGNPFRLKKEGMPSTQTVPTGKTLIACLVLKEAIWRRLYTTNRADTYALTSYQTLRQDLRQKTERASSLKEYDWLAIDDVSLPLNETDFNHQNFVTLFDDFLMTRIENRQPTILCCDFDALAKDYTDSLGYSFQKMVTSKNTFLIKAGD
jgi:hypothetical protein